MDKTSELHFGKIIETIDENTRLSNEAFEKLLVALTGIFRLLDGEQTILATLQGRPEEVQAYILNLLGQVKSMVADGYGTLKEEIQNLARILEKS